MYQIWCSCFVYSATTPFSGAIKEADQLSPPRLHSRLLHPDWMDPPSISSLPVELLLKIFREGQRLERRRGLHRWIITITHICLYWRTIALQTPDLWTSVDAVHQTDCLNAFLERSKPLLLNINASLDFFQSPLLELPVLFCELARCRSLWLGRPFLDQFSNASHPWHQCAQTVETIEYTDIASLSQAPETTLPPLFDHELASLKSLTWLGWRFGPMRINCPRLTDLSFTMPTVKFSWIQWLDFLRNTPLLQRLELQEAILEQPLNPNAPRSRPELVVNLAHLSTLILSGSRDTFRANGAMGELALFSHLDFPSHVAIELSVSQPASIIPTLDIVEARFTWPMFHSRRAAMVAIDCTDDAFHFSVWDTLPEPTAICWQWQETRSYSPPASMRFYFPVLGPSVDNGRFPDPAALHARTLHNAVFHARALRMLSRVYPLNLVETLVLKVTVMVEEHSAIVVDGFSDLLQQMTNVQTLYLRGKHVEFLERVLSQTPAAPAHAGLPPLMHGPGVPLLFPSLRTISLWQDGSAGNSMIIPPTPVPSIDAIAASLQERKLSGDCRIDVVHICGQSDLQITMPGRLLRCGGSCFDVTDPFAPRPLPRMYGSDSSKR